MPRPTPRLAAAGRVPTDICGHRRRGPLGPLAALSGPPGAGVRPGHIPGSPRHCDIHKLQRHRQQNVPKCRGNWSPAARPRKLCPGGQGPCKQQESRLPAAQTPGGLARAAGPGAEDAGPTPRGSSAEQLGSQPDGGSELPAVLLRVREEKPLLSPQGSLRHGHGVAEPAASTLAVGTGSDLCRAEGTRVDLPGGLTAPGAEPRAAAARQRPHSCSLTSARLRGAPHQGGGSTHTPHRRRPQRSAAPWPWDAPTLTPGGDSAAISLAQRGRGAETHTWPWSRDPQMWSHVAQGSVHPETRISRVERCTYCPAQSQGTVMAKRTASWGCSARGEAPPGTDGDRGCPPGTLAIPSPQASYDRGRPTTAPRRVCGEAPRGHQHTGQWWGPALGLCEALWGHSGMDQAT